METASVFLDVHNDNGAGECMRSKKCLSSDDKLLWKLLARWELNQGKGNLVTQRVTSCNAMEGLQLPSFLITAGCLRFCKNSVQHMVPVDLSMLQRSFGSQNGLKRTGLYPCSGYRLATSYLILVLPCYPQLCISPAGELF